MRPHEHHLDSSCKSICKPRNGLEAECDTENSSLSYPQSSRLRSKLQRLDTNCIAIKGWFTELYCCAPHQHGCNPRTALQPGDTSTSLFPQPICAVGYSKGGTDRPRRDKRFAPAEMLHFRPCSAQAACSRSFDLYRYRSPVGTIGRVRVALRTNAEGMQCCEAYSLHARICTKSGEIVEISTHVHQEGIAHVHSLYRDSQSLYTLLLITGQATPSIWVHGSDQITP